MYSSRKPIRTRGGAGGSGTVGARLTPGRGLAPHCFGREGQARQSSSLLPVADRALGQSRGTHQWHLVLGGRGYSRTGDSGERGTVLVQTRLHQFSADSENIDKIEGGSLAAYEGGVPMVRQSLCPHVPVPAPSAPCSPPKPLPPLGTSPPPDPTAPRLPVVLPHWLEDIGSSRATLPVVPPAASRGDAKGRGN